ncbi:MAG: Na+/H+ antiporter subunit D [Actinomycetaceae bacterium]|nr:Na+/H+ antiporter subunit D [Actinomycetaceae bacterium]
MSWLLTLPVLIPFLGAGLALMLSRWPRLQVGIAVGALTSVWVVAAVLTYLADAGPVVLDVGSWTAPLGITLVADRLAAVMLLISVSVTLGVQIYSIAQGVADSDASNDGQPVPVSIFHPTFLILSAGVSNAFLTGDLFNLYVSFEILLAASFVLITLGGTPSRIRSGTVYVVVSLLSSIIFLVGLAAAYAAAGTVNIAHLSTRLTEIDPRVALVIQVTLLTAFCIKAAVFPLSAWLPDSYPTAPAPVTAVFAGLLTKVGIYAIIRTQTILFPSSEANTVLGIAGIATMLVGILGAIAQDDLKRVLSFTLVSHIGYLLWGITMTSTQGLASAIFYALHHIVVQTTLFLVVGLIERYGGSTSLRELGSLVRTAPLLAILFGIPALNLAGVPPFTGFLGKVGLIEASAHDATVLGWSLLAAGVMTSLMTLYVMAKVWNNAFWAEGTSPLLRVKHRTVKSPRTTESTANIHPSTAPTPAETHPLAHTAQAVASSAKPTKASHSTSAQTLSQLPNTRVMVGAAAALVVLQLAMSLFSGPLYDYSTRAADSLQFKTPYVHAVLGTDSRGEGKSADITDRGVVK